MRWRWSTEGERAARRQVKLGALLVGPALSLAAHAAMGHAAAAHAAAAHAAAGAPLFRVFDARGKEGFVDGTGRTVIVPRFEEVADFAEGLAGARIGKLWGFIDRSGKVVIVPRWESVVSFSEGVALVTEASVLHVIDEANYWRYRSGWIDRKGAYVIAPAWRKSAGSFHGGLAAVELDWLSPEYERSPAAWAGYLDRKGKWAIPPRYHGAGDFADGFGLAYTYGESGAHVGQLVDPAGKALVLPDGWVPAGGFAEGLASVREAGTERLGCVDRTGKLVFTIAGETKWDVISAFSERARGGPPRRAGWIRGCKGEGRRRADLLGRRALFGWARDGRARQGTLIHIDRTGRELSIPSPGTPLGPFRDGLQYRHLYTWTIAERPDGRNIYGYMNRAGKYVWVSPRAETYLDDDWFRAWYVGPAR